VIRACSDVAGAVDHEVRHSARPHLVKPERSGIRALAVDEVLDDRSAVVPVGFRRRVAERRRERWRGRWQRRVVAALAGGAGRDERDGAHSRGVSRSELLRDPLTHRHPDDVRAIDVQRVEHAQRVRRQFVRRVVRSAGW